MLYQIIIYNTILVYFGILAIIREFVLWHAQDIFLINLNLNA